MHGASPRLLCHRLLGEEALYRVIAKSGGLVEVEVVHAPGLERGRRVLFTDAAVCRMAQVDELAVELDGGPVLQPRVSV